MKYFILIISTGILATHASFASNEFEQIQDCGGVIKIEGNQCKSAKVTLSFSGCELSQKPVTATKVICEHNSLKARYSSEDFRFQGQASMTQDDWGDTTWKSVGKLSQWKKKKTPEKSREIASEETSEGIKVEGFVDLQYRWIEDDNVNTGYRINDAALYFSHSYKDINLFLDLPFAFDAEQDTNDNDITETENKNQISFSQGKAQAFVNYKKSKFDVTFGQFDTIYGFELNDAKDLFFSIPGETFSKALPVTHSGLLLAYSDNGFTTKLLASNAKNQGVYNGTNPEYGAQIGYAKDNYYLSIGYLTHNPANLGANPVNGTEDTLLDIVAGYSYAGFDINIEYDTLQDSSLADDPNAMMIHITYKLRDNLILGARYDLANEFSGAYKTTQVSGGINYLHNKHLRVKLDTTNNQVEVNKGDDSLTSAGANLSAVYSF